MTIQNGRELIIRRKNGAVFENICQLQQRSVAITNSMIERVTAPCLDLSGTPVRTYKPGVQDLVFEGTALFENSAQHRAMAEDARLQRLVQYQVAVPGYGVFEGDFYVRNANFAGEVQGDLTLAVSLVAGDPDYTFTPAA